MPQLDQAKKALRVAQRRRAVNDRWRAKYRAALRAVRDAIKSQDKKAAEEALVSAQSNLDRASQRNIINHRTAARYKSRLSQAIAKLAK